MTWNLDENIAQYACNLAQGDLRLVSSICDYRKQQMPVKSVNNETMQMIFRG